MSKIHKKQILVGVTGGIAAYKSADLVRRLRRAGAVVRVAVTDAATRFVTPLTFQALSGQPVHQHLLDASSEAAMDHIHLARWADAIVVAPASANFLARLAQGFADDLLTTVCLSSAAPLIVVPAMNQQMWRNRATQANCRLLLERGVQFYGPEDGQQACGEVGPGRMVEPERIVLLMSSLFADDSLDGIRVLITAGPTREALDPVRFISNRSSGKMGFAVAHAAALVGADVTLISGPVERVTPYKVTRLNVVSAAEMRDAVLSRVGECDIFISAAAVADYRPQQYASHKIKKSSAEQHVTLVPTTDILAEIAHLPKKPFTVGFAAETENVLENARAKLETKHLDMIAANQVGEPGTGFEADENALTVLWQEGDEVLPRMPKEALAVRLIEQIAKRYNAKHTT